MGESKRISSRKRSGNWLIIINIFFIPKQNLYDDNKLQHLIIECSSNKSEFPRGSNDKMFQYVMDEIQKNEDYKVWS